MGILYAHLGAFGSVELQIHLFQIATRMREISWQYNILYLHLSSVMRKPTFWFPTWSDTKQAVQLQRMARGLKFRIYKEEGSYCVAKTKALISFAVTVKLICVFVFAYAKRWFSHVVAHFIQCFHYIVEIL